MDPQQREWALGVARKLMPPEEFDHIAEIGINDLGFGYDQFGMEREAMILAYSVARYLHKYYFRVESEGHHHIPLRGPGLVVSNHSGTLPFDAAITAVDVAMHTDPPRPLRAIVDNFAGFLPFINVFFYRVGQVIGHRRNFRDLLETGELVGVWPEGTRGLGKPYSQRYNLMKFGMGFIELSLTHRAPIIPVAVVGAEEQMPMAVDLKPLARAFGFPYFPVPALLPVLGPFAFLPLPVKYHIYYGEPIHYFEEYGPETVDNPETIRMLADKTKLVIQDLVDQGLEKRSSVFGMEEE